MRSPNGVYRDARHFSPLRSGGHVVPIRPRDSPPGLHGANVRAVFQPEVCGEIAGRRPKIEDVARCHAKDATRVANARQYLCSVRERYGRGMTDPKDRIAEAMVAAGVTVGADVARRAGINPVTMAAYLRGERKPPLHIAERIGAALGVSGRYIFDGTKAADRPTPNPYQVKVIGETQAGLWREANAFSDDEPAPVPAVRTKFSASRQFAYRVRGTSMNAERIFDGDYVVCVPYFEARPKLTTGDVVVIERRRNGETETTVKFLEVRRGLYELRPKSTDSRHKEPIIVVLDHHADDGTEIEVVGLVIGVFSPRE